MQQPMQPMMNFINAAYTDDHQNMAPVSATNASHQKMLPNEVELPNDYDAAFSQTGFPFGNGSPGLNIVS